MSQGPHWWVQKRQLNLSEGRGERVLNHVGTPSATVTLPTQPGHGSRWGMRVEVWTMVLWLGAALLADAVTFAMATSPTVPLAPRVVGAGAAALAIAALLVMRRRTPRWLIHALLVAAITFMVWFTGATSTSSMAISAMLIMLIVAGYCAYMLPPVAALAYATLSAAGLLGVLTVTGRLEVLFLPWAILTSMAFIEVLILGMVVADLKQQVVIDPLTGLLNRAGLALVTCGTDAERTWRDPRSVLVLDLDNFKAINDEFGHVEGDRVLAEVGRTILKVCRKGDAAIRCGGDEFILVLPNTDATSAESMAARLRRELAAPCSTGVSLWASDEAIHHAIARADKQMYGQKVDRRAPVSGLAQR